MAITVSSAVADITPPVGEPMGGHAADQPRLATGTYAPLYVRCVVLRDGAATRAVVSIDVLGLGRAAHLQLRAALVALAGWSAADILIVTSHTHSGPALPDVLDPYAAYNLTDTSSVDSAGRRLHEQVVACVTEALDASQTPCTLDYATTSQAWSTNREGLPYAETAVPVLTCRDTTGQPRAVLFGYGCHPVAAGIQTRWDPDWPGAAAAVIEAAIPGCAAVFIPGPAGDQNPSGTQSWALRNRLGAQLGAAVVTASSLGGRQVALPTCSFTEFAAPLDVTDTPGNRQALTAVFTARRDNTALLGWRRRHAQGVIQRLTDPTPLPTTVPVPLVAWRFGGSPVLRLAQLGHELVSGYAVWARARWGADRVWLGGYGGETCCYLPSNELLPPLRSGGSYAGGWDTDYPGVAGASMCVYSGIGHYKAGNTGVEPAVLAALTTALS